MGAPCSSDWCCARCSPGGSETRRALAEVLGRYSNLGQTGVRLAKAAELPRQERRPVPWQPPTLSAKARVRRLVDAEIDVLVAEYRSGIGCCRLAQRYGLAESTVLAKLRAAGRGIRTRRKLSPEDMVEVRRLRAVGWTQQQIADQCGVTRAVSLRLTRLAERPDG